VGVLIIPSRDHRVIDGDVHEREIACGELPGNPVLEVLGDRDLAPAIRGCPGVPIRDAIEGRAIAPGCDLRELVQLLVGRGAIGRRRETELRAGGDDPCLPGASLWLDRPDLLGSRW
jgi:hypothetical protein